MCVCVCVCVFVCVCANARARVFVIVSVKGVLVSEVFVWNFSFHSHKESVKPISMFSHVVKKIEKVTSLSKLKLIFSFIFFLNEKLLFFIIIYFIIYDPYVLLCYKTLKTTVFSFSEFTTESFLNQI